MPIETTIGLGPLSGPQAYQLTKAVTSVDREISSVTLREPTGKDIRSADPDAPDYTHRLIARLANITPEALDDMAARDVMALGRIVAAFLAEIRPRRSSIATSSADAGGETLTTS